MYLAVKHSHLTLVLISVVLFYFRYVQHRVFGKDLAKWLRVVPHIIDTFLIISAIALCVLIQQYPLVNPWLSYKVLFVIGYIGFAMAAMKIQSKNRSIAMLTFASICLLFTAKLAVTKALF